MPRKTVETYPLFPGTFPVW